MKKGPINVKHIQSVNLLPGISRKTLTYNDNVMLCIITFEKGTEVPLHDHQENQIGYVMKGKLKFITETREFTAEQGDSYVFDSYEKHGAKAIEQAEIIEIFSPGRDDYK